ncbi:MAG: hypothetical protein AB2L07_10175 [Thermoanaerobaculaceae bacterium]
MTWRGVVRWSVRGVAGLVVLVLVWLLAGRIHAARRLDAAREAFKRDVGPLELSAWASPPVPDEENAAIPIRAGATGLVLSGEDRTLVGSWAMGSVPSPTAEQVAALRRIVEANTPALESVARGARLERSNFHEELRREPPELDAKGRPDFSSGPGSRAPLVGCINAGRLLRAAARLATLDGDRAQALGSLETVFGLARALYQEPLVMHQLIANAIERIGLGETISVALAGDTAPAELERLQRMQLDTDLRAAWKRVQATEALISMDTVSRARQSRRNPYGIGPWERLKDAAWGGADAAIGLELRQEAIALYDQPAGLRVPVTERSTRADRSRWFLLGLVSPLDAAKAIIRIVGMGEAAKASARLQATAAQRSLVRLVLELRLSALRSGTYPPDLTGFPGADVPDPFTGKPLVYERRPDGSAALSMPGGEALWKEVTKGMPTPCPFTVTLPPPATSRGAA